MGQTNKTYTKKFEEFLDKELVIHKDRKVEEEEFEKTMEQIDKLLAMDPPEKARRRNK